MELAQLRAAFPSGGLFAEKDWLMSPEPFRIDEPLREELEKLGYRLNLFQRACNELYHQSVAGKKPAWIAEWLDRGKPAELVALGRERKLRADLPRVIRPDLVLTDEGFTIAETDSVPGGIGLTAWLNQTYANLGYDVLGGPRGMVEGFRDLLGGPAEILVSKEAATYRPEMEWLAGEINAERGTRSAELAEAEAERGMWNAGQEGGGAQGREVVVREAESYEAGAGSGTVYRFFELFDLPNIPSAPGLMKAAAEQRLNVTPPFKAYLEEKMWFALFWLQPLRTFWRRELSERHFLKLQKAIPYTWMLDPTPLPPHGVIPHLDVNAWNDVAEFSQKQRDLILKISGFSELAWGSRSVELGSDLSQHEWRTELQHALAVAGEHPYLLQRFHKGRLVEQPYFDAEDGSRKVMRGRVRLCPYYFLLEGKAHLRGALATVCPADKKLLHGMKDAILVPAAVGKP